MRAGIHGARLAAGADAQGRGQKAAIRDTIEAIRAFTGKAPRGWESPGLTETADTIDYLPRPASNTCQLGVDDQPVYIRPRRAP